MIAMLEAGPDLLAPRPLPNPPPFLASSFLFLLLSSVAQHDCFFHSVSWLRTGRDMAPNATTTTTSSRVLDDRRASPA